MQLKKKDHSPIATATLASAISALIFFTVLALACCAAYLGGDPTRTASGYTLCALTVSGALGGLVLTKMRSRFGASYAIAASCALAVIYLVASTASSGGFSPKQLLNLACYGGAAALGILLGKGGAKKRHRR